MQKIYMRTFIYKIVRGFILESPIKVLPKLVKCIKRFSIIYFLYLPYYELISFKYKVYFSFFKPNLWLWSIRTKCSTFILLLQAHTHYALQQLISWGRLPLKKLLRTFIITGMFQGEIILKNLFCIFKRSINITVRKNLFYICVNASMILSVILIFLICNINKFSYYFSLPFYKLTEKLFLFLFSKEVFIELLKIIYLLIAPITLLSLIIISLIALGFLRGNYKIIHCKTYIVGCASSLLFSNLYYFIQIDSWLTTILAYYALISTIFIINLFLLTVRNIKRGAKIGVQYNQLWFHNYLIWVRGDIPKYEIKSMSIEDYFILYNYPRILQNFFIGLIKKFNIDIDFSYVEYYMHFKIAYIIGLFPVYLYYGLICWIYEAYTYNQKNIYNNYEIPELCCKNFNNNGWRLVIIILLLVNLFLFIFIITDFNCQIHYIIKRGNFYGKNVKGHSGVCCRVSLKSKVTHLYGYGCSRSRVGAIFNPISRKYWIIESSKNSNLIFDSRWYSKAILKYYEKSFVSSIEYAITQQKNNLDNEKLLLDALSYFEFLMKGDVIK